ncbi:histone-lysine N-methyltransferase SMYD3-like [Ostrea edulis]|uniref:histone-lysine N-methyltransferase SMYD3-like n=1 Tax=Ostrea edulis TaxID=37623 RepID=UPI0024AF4F62|nr:histone-lysine N-methyltransferase SMYD3-like [Ostrea edulis]
MNFLYFSTNIWKKYIPERIMFSDASSFAVAGFTYEKDKKFENMVEAGALLCVSEPFVHVLANKEHEFRCEYCMERADTLKRCSACGTMKYCSITCQKADWFIHKKECPCLKRIQPNVPTDSTRLLLRLVIRFTDSCLSQGSRGELVLRRSFSALMSHEKEIQSDGKRCEQLSQHLFTLQKVTSGILNLPSSTDLLQIFGKMTTNSFTICGEEMQSIGVGIYLGPSLLDHRCKPNAVITFQGKFLHLRAVTPVSNPSPSNIFISYIDQLDTGAERRRSLREQYYFHCDCSWCKDQELEKTMQAIKCPEQSCKEGHVTVTDDDATDISCTVCGLSVSDESFIQKALGLEEDCRRCLEKAKAGKQSNDPDQVLNVCEQCLKCYAEFYHPLNLSFVKILDYAFDASVDLQLWEKAVDYGSKTLPAYRKYYPPYSPNVGIQLLKLGKIQLYLQNLKEALRFLQQANDILSVTHGEDHMLHKQLKELLDQTQEEMRSRLENGS